MKKFLKALLIIIPIIAIAGLLAFGAWSFFKSRTTEIPGKSEQKTQDEQRQERKVRQEALLETIKELFTQKSPGTSFSLSVYDLKNNEYFGLDDTQPQHAASVSKILTAVYVFDQVEKGETTLANPMGAYNVEAQIQFLINQSSQDSWDLLDERFKTSAQNEFAKSIGLTATDVTRGNNKMATKDVALLLKKLADGDLLNEAHRSKLFSYMQKTESEDYFSPALTLEGATFYHKTGKYLGEGHDAAIILHKKNPFVLVVFTNNNINTNLIGRGTIMQETATAVYDYFDKLD